MKYYANLIGVFVRQFPIVTARVAGTEAREMVTYHEAQYLIVGDPNGNGSRYAFDVVVYSKEVR